MIDARIFPSGSIKKTERTVLVLLANAVKTNYFPDTLGAAYAHVSKHGGELRTLKNPILEHDDARNAVQEIKSLFKNQPR